MTTRLGVEWGDVVKGQAKIAGLDGELLGPFSRRSEQVARAAERRPEVWRREHPGSEPSERERAIVVRDAALPSRPAKDHSRPGEVRADHLAIAAEHGWDAERVSSEVLGRSGVALGRDEFDASDVARVGEDVLRGSSAGGLCGVLSRWSAPCSSGCRSLMVAMLGGSCGRRSALRGGRPWSLP